LFFDSQTGHRQTDGRTYDRYIDPDLHTMWAVSVTHKVNTQRRVTVSSCKRYISQVCPVFNIHIMLRSSQLQQPPVLSLLVTNSRMTQ